MCTPKAEHRSKSRSSCFLPNRRDNKWSPIENAFMSACLSGKTDMPHLSDSSEEMIQTLCSKICISSLIQSWPCLQHDQYLAFSSLFYELIFHFLWLQLDSRKSRKITKETCMGVRKLLKKKWWEMGSVWYQLIKRVVASRFWRIFNASFEETCLHGSTLSGFFFIFLNFNGIYHCMHTRVCVHVGWLQQPHTYF